MAIGTTAAILGLIGGGSSLLGGLLGKSASTKAAEAQVAAAKQAEQEIQGLLDKYNPPIGTAAQQAADLSTQASSSAIQNFRDLLAGNRTDVLGGVSQANQLLAPYRRMSTGLAGNVLGQLSNLMAPGGDLNRTFNYQDIQNLDPGYQFRMDQASKALQASAAARGGALGGGTLNALMNLNQNMASAETQNAFARLTQSQQDRFNRLNSLLGTGLNYGVQTSGAMGQNILGGNQLLANQALTAGQNIGQWMIQPAQYAGTALLGAAGTQAQNAMSAGSSIANLMTSAGNAQAAGIIGGANSLANMLAGITNAGVTAAQYQQDQDLLRQLQNRQVYA